MANPLIETGSVFDERFEQTYLQAEDYEEFALSLPDDRLTKLLIDSLEKNVEYWNRAPYRLQQTDEENVKFFLGDQMATQLMTTIQSGELDYTDNRLFQSVRAIVSYATGQLAMPEITPSRSDNSYLRMARSIQMALYQHSVEEMTDQKFRAALFNLLLRKRAFLKLRWDPFEGIYGDVVTEVCDPADIIIDREARYRKNPPVIYQRVRKTVDEWCYMFPKHADQIYRLFNFKRGTLNQLSKVAPGFECWFTFRDKKGIPREGLTWFFHDPGILLLDKVPNPNWVYTGDDTKDKKENVLFHAPKPYTSFNYINLGYSYIDETTLFDQAKPLQRILNERQKQIHQNAGYQNGRWVANKKALEEADGVKLINKGAKTVTLVDADDVTKAVANMAPASMPNWVVDTIMDLRNEIDTMMGTPSIFKGANPENKDTLGRDMMLKQQAGMLQDDLVRCVQYAYQDYYGIKLQMFRTFFTDDYWFSVKGGDGKFDFVMLNGDSIDSNVRIGVEVDSTLPLDKSEIRQTAKDLLQANKIDYLTAMEDMGLPDPEIRTERFMRSQIDAYTYMQSIETQLDSNDAEVDIMLVKAGRTPQERDEYDENYLNYFNDYISKNEFKMLSQDVQQKLMIFLQEVSQRAQRTAQLGSAMLNQAGILNRPPIFPLPKRTENIRLEGQMSPQTTQQIAGTEGQLFTPVTGAEQAQNPNQQAGQQLQQAAPPNQNVPGTP